MNLLKKKIRNLDINFKYNMKHLKITSPARELRNVVVVLVKRIRIFIIMFIFCHFIDYVQVMQHWIKV